MWPIEYLEKKFLKYILSVNNIDQDMENQTQICTPDENQKKGKLCCCGPEEICNYYDGSQYKQMVSMDKC